MNFGLLKFKLGECLFFRLKYGKYLLRRAKDSSYSQPKYNTRARSTQLLYIKREPKLVKYFILQFAFLVEFLRKV
jgi:hypothetical protein